MTSAGSNAPISVRQAPATGENTQRLALDGFRSAQMTRFRIGLVILIGSGRLLATTTGVGVPFAGRDE